MDMLDSQKGAMLIGCQEYNVTHIFKIMGQRLWVENYET